MTRSHLVPKIVLQTTLGLASTPALAQSVAAPAAPTSAPATGHQDVPVLLKVFEKGTGVPLGKVEVKLGDHASLTSPDGAVSLTVPASGDGEIQIYRPGFEKATVDFDDLREGGGETDVYLIPGITANTIVVTGERNTDVTKKTISVEEASKVSPGGDPAQVVKTLPGVQSRGLSTEVIVWGSGPHDTGYYIDDLQVPYIFHNFDNLSVIPAEFLQSVEFSAGGFGVEYGDATGGIITLRTKTEIPERPQTDFVINVPFYSGITHTRPLDETSSLTVGIRQSYIDLVLKALLDRGGGSSGRGSLTIAPQFGDAEAMYLKKRDDGYTKVSLLSAYDGLKAAVPSSSAENEDGRANFDMYTGFVNLGVEQNQRLNKDWQYKTTPQVYYYDSTADVGASTDDYTLTKVRAPTEWTRRLGRNENLYLGVDPAWAVARQDVYAVVPHPNDPSFDPEEAPLVKSVDNEVYTTVAGWAAVDIGLGPVIVTPGVRSFYDSQIGKGSYDPRLKARYPLDERSTLKAAVGRYSESPSPIEASPTRGNPHLGFIESNHYVVGVESNWNEAWTTEEDVYYKTGTGLVTGDPATVYTNGGAMRSEGFELFLRRHLTERLFGWLSYTWSKTTQQDTPGGPWHDADYDQTNVLDLVGDYKLTGQWDIGGRYDYHTGDTYSTVSGSVFNTDVDKYEARPTSSDKDAARMPAFNAIDLYLTHAILYDRWKLQLRFGVENYWPRPQVAAVHYNYDYTQTENLTNLTSVPFIELKGSL